MWGGVWLVFGTVAFVRSTNLVEKKEMSEAWNDIATEFPSFKTKRWNKICLLVTVTLVDVVLWTFQKWSTSKRQWENKTFGSMYCIGFLFCTNENSQKIDLTMNEKFGNLSATKLDRRGRPQYNEHFPCFFFRENKVARNTSKRVLYSLKVTIYFCQSFWVRN